MKVLNFSLDETSLQKDSPLAQRLIDYGGLLEKLTVLVPFSETTQLALSPLVQVLGSGGKKKWQRFFRLYRLGSQLLQTGGYDIITTQDQYFVGFLASLLARRFHIGLEVQVHGSEKDFGIRGMLAKYILPRAQAVRVVSNRLAEKLVQHYGVSREKITVVPIYSEAEGKDFPKDYAVKDQFTFLTVGRLVEVKNVALQIDAFKDLLQKTQKKVQLLIVGTGPLEKQLRQQIQDLHLEPSIKLCGFKNRQELSELYKTSDCFLLTSFNEGWPRVIVEAGSYGLPILMTDVGSAGELVENNISGRVVPIDQKANLVEALMEIIEDQSLREKFGANVRARIAQLPSKEEILHLYFTSWHKAKL